VVALGLRGLDIQFAGKTQLQIGGQKVRNGYTILRMSIKNKMNRSIQNLPLSELSCGMRAILLEPQSSSRPEVMRLIEMGMVNGNEVKLLRRGPMGSPLHISVCGTDLCLRKEEAALFWVQPL
jgi:ferrous iron transport protein A